MDSITYSDYYLLANDFADYLATQERVDAVYRDPAAWAKMSIMSTAGSGFFSSDRTIAEVGRGQREGGRGVGQKRWGAELGGQRERERGGGQRRKIVCECLRAGAGGEMGWGLGMSRAPALCAHCC